MQNTEVACHISSSEDSHAPFSEQRIKYLCCPDPLIPPDHSLLRLLRFPFGSVYNACRQKVFLLSSHLFHLPSVQMVHRIYVPLWHHPHQMQVRYERCRYHRTWLHNHHSIQRKLSCAALPHNLLRTDTTVHILYILSLFLYMFLILHRLVCLLPALWFQERYPAKPLP